MMELARFGFTSADSPVPTGQPFNVSSMDFPAARIHLVRYVSMTGADYTGWLSGASDVLFGTLEELANDQRVYGIAHQFNDLSGRVTEVHLGGFLVAMPQWVYLQGEGRVEVLYERWDVEPREWAALARRTIFALS